MRRPSNLALLFASILITGASVAGFTLASGEGEVVDPCHVVYNLDDLSPTGEFSAPADVDPEACIPATTTTSTTTTTTTTLPPTTTTVAPTTTTTQPPQAQVVWSEVAPGPGRHPQIAITPAPVPAGVTFYRNGVLNRTDATPNPYEFFPAVTLANGDILRAEWSSATGPQFSEHVVGGSAPTTTAPPTTTTPPATTTTPPPTTAPPTTAPPSGASFVETFNGNTGLDRFDVGVWHRNIGSQELGSNPIIHGDNNASHGGSWSADHNLSCGTPATQRQLSSVKIQDTNGSNGWQPIVDFNLDQVVYTCVDHVMTSMGDVDGYSVLAFSPKQVFNDVSEVSFDVNLTDLGTRQWWKVGVLSVADCPALDERCMYSDVGASNLPGDLKTSSRVIATWSGGASAGHPGNLMIGNQSDPNGGSGTFNAGSDKMTRHPVTFSDNGSGTITFRVGETAVRTTSGSFPNCPCRVVFYDHNYTPEKSESGFPIGFTWHWDNIIVE